MSSFGPTTAVFEGLGRDVMPDMLIDSEGADAFQSGDSSAAIVDSSGAIARHRVRQVVPSCRARPWTEACSRRSCRMAHQDGRVVSSARGAATRSSCSVTSPPEQSGSAHHHARLRQRSSTGRPQQGVSISRASRRPWLPITTPQDPAALDPCRRLDLHPQQRPVLAAHLLDGRHVQLVETAEKITAGAVATGRARARARCTLGHRRGLPIDQLGRYRSLGGLDPTPRNSDPLVGHTHLRFSYEEPDNKFDCSILNTTEQILAGQACRHL